MKEVYCAIQTSNFTNERNLIEVIKLHRISNSQEFSITLSKHNLKGMADKSIIALQLLPLLVYLTPDSRF